MLLKSQAKLTEGVGESFLLAAYFGALDRLFIEKGQPALVEVTTHGLLYTWTEDLSSFLQTLCQLI